MSGDSLSEREQLIWLDTVARVIAGSGITDLALGERWVRIGGIEAGRVEVRLLSRSRGWVLAGTVPHADVKADLYDAIVPYVEALEDKRRAPLVAKTRKSEANIQRAVELHAGGNSPNRIAQVMTAERGTKTDPRTVRAWLAAAKKRMDRERSDSP